ncbi:MAG TPA: hypothetical protein VKH37_05585 [Ferruginibacter sp.]|nr:hypothetical protein [Ferruginibacter sp.]
MMLKKIKIESYKEASCSGSPLATIYAFINPSQYTRSVSVNYKNPETVGDSQSTYVFANYGEEKLDLGDIIVDGTGLVKVANNKDVDGYIKNFQKVVCDYIGEVHRPPFLKITWGNLSIICVCQSFNVTYTLFNPDGTALRAKIKLGLICTVDFDTKMKQARTSSPDLTHMRTVKAGDTLPLLTYQVYGDCYYYKEVARVNGLSSVNDIEPGDQLYFPPLKN